VSGGGQIEASREYTDEKRTLEKGERMTKKRIFLRALVVAMTPLLTVGCSCGKGQNQSQNQMPTPQQMGTLQQFGTCVQQNASNGQDPMFCKCCALLNGTDLSSIMTQIQQTQPQYADAASKCANQSQNGCSSLPSVQAAAQAPVAQTDPNCKGTACVPAGVIAVQKRPGSSAPSVPPLAGGTQPPDIAKLIQQKAANNLRILQESGYVDGSGNPVPNATAEARPPSSGGIQKVEIGVTRIQDAPNDDSKDERTPASVAPAPSGGAIK
jgi:hypothetical protein